MAERQIDGDDDSVEQDEDVRILIPSIETEVPSTTNNSSEVLGLLEEHSAKEWFQKLRYLSPLRLFQKAVDNREEVSLSVSSPVSFHTHFNIDFIHGINWPSISDTLNEWIKHPKNIFLMIWLICVTVSVSMLILLLLGILDKAFPQKSSRNHWIEIINQVLNALFTLMSLYQHPNLFYHFFLLCRWRSKDVRALRKVYSKNGAYRPYEWMHMMVVVGLLHITCFAQYVSCGLYWRYLEEQRPEFAETFFFVLGLAAPATAGAYAVYSPLGRDCDEEFDEEPQTPTSDTSKNYFKPARELCNLRFLENEPKWAGGMLDCGDDITVGCLSLFCTCCVFGWNMERLGFGNMFVHMVTFLLLCIAPLWIFNITALKIQDNVVGDMVGMMGIILCVFGLLYGGFWRIQMRKRFRLPSNTICCESASLTDYLQWMFCWSCSLAQEVRTGSLYDVEDDNLYRKNLNNEEDNHPLLNPLPRENGLNPLSRYQLNRPSFHVQYQAQPMETTEASELAERHDDHERIDIKESALFMQPPVQPLVQKDTHSTASNGEM